MERTLPSVDAPNKPAKTQHAIIRNKIFFVMIAREEACMCPSFPTLTTGGTVSMHVLQGKAPVVVESIQRTKEQSF